MRQLLSEYCACLLILALGFYCLFCLCALSTHVFSCLML
uniref:Uncharacterized protein n=1 Tax=Arundo donax TaxID=35708 RepID=A0A0A9H2F2_ARUDO